MRDDGRRYRQELIIAELGVPAGFDARAEVERRVGFLVEQLTETGARGYVLGISGGVDSGTAGRLCQLAVERVRAGSGEAIVNKVPTADLETDRPGLPDEAVLGLSYDA